MRSSQKRKVIERTLEAIGCRSGSAYILLNKDHIPLYVSESIKNLTGLNVSDVMADIYALEWCMSDEEKLCLKKQFGELNNSEEYANEFSFKNIETNEQKNGKITITDFNDTILIEITDMSAEFEVRNRLKTELDKAKNEERQKSDFWSKMSHEIRTPMNGILGMLTLAKMCIDDKKEALECLDKASNLSEFLLSLINDILDMSKIESGKVVLEREKLDLLEIYNQIYEMFANSIKQKGINFEMKMEDMEIRYVIGDSLRLVQILINFISNASKYTDKGGKIEVVFREVNRTENKVHMLFKIKDNGKGMNPEFLNSIFKPFEQEEASTTRKYGGTGLGMAIADNLVTLMGGHIVVDTALGRGTEFSVYIPLDIADVEQSWNTETKTTEKDESVHSISGMRILMAEDNPINAEIVKDILEKDNVMTDIADDGDKAVEMFKASKNGYYDMILMDIQMQNVDGWTAAKQIRSIRTDYAQTIPIYALSANAYIEDKRHSIEVGMNGHISKPIDFEKLKEIMSKVRINKNFR